MQSLSVYHVASIFWLPAKDQIPDEHLYATNGIDDGCFNHPVLILWVDQNGTEAIVLMVTSFGGQDLQERHPHNLHVRSRHLPIHPSKPHPDNGSLLFLRDNALLSRNSYIKTEPQRTIKAILLRPSRYQTCTLRTDSYIELVKSIGFKAPPVTFITEPRVIHVTPPVSRVSPGLSNSLNTGSRAWASYPVSVQQSNNRPDYSSRRNERTPLLPPVHSAWQHGSDDSQDSSVVRNILIFAVLFAGGWWLWGKASE